MNQGFINAVRASIPDNTGVENDVRAALRAAARIILYIVATSGDLADEDAGPTY